MDDVVDIFLEEPRQIRRVREIDLDRLDSKPSQPLRDTVTHRAYYAIPRFREVFGGVRPDVPARTCNKNRFHLHHPH